MFSDQNRITFGYSGGVLNKKKTQNSLQWNFDRCQRPVFSFKDECIHAARLISDRASSLGRIPFVLLSGGHDSEVVCKSFIEAGLPFQAISVQYDNNDLDFETEFILPFVRRHGIRHQFRTRDWYTWIAQNKIIFDAAECTYCSIMPMFELAEFVFKDLGGLPILGSGNTLIEQHDDQMMFMAFEALRTPLYKYSVHAEFQVVPLFYQYTPELVLSYLLEPEVQDHGYRGILRTGSKSKWAFSSETVSTKYDVYERFWPDLLPRKKLTQCERKWWRYKSIDGAWNLSRKIKYNEIIKTQYANLVQDLTFQG